MDSGDIGMLSNCSSSWQFVSVAAIIPAYNESGRIGKVLAILHDVEELSQIIVVDDGSTDDTYAEVQHFAKIDPRLRCVQLPVNGGKGGAMFAGARATRAKILLFLDGDLLGLKPEHVQDLILPVCTENYDMTVGVFRGGKFLTDMAHLLAPWLSGQRCLPAELFFSVDEHSARGYSVETAISLAANRHRWHSRYLALRGVWHPTSETRHGIWNGLHVRSKMYTDIIRILLVDRFGKPSLSKLSWKHLFVALILVVLGYSLGYDHSMAASRLHLTDLPVLTLSQFPHVLVIVPHPDDEVLGSGGVIQAALANGSDVRVVIVTNGDGQALGPLVLRGKMLPHPIDYVVDGEVRQAESLTALGVLGLSPDAVEFLGYPDHQLNKLWMDDWNTQCPLRAKYTRDSRSPYPRTYDRQAVYCGVNILNDLWGMITEYKPDLVLLPHPNDENPDHRATSNFGRMAIAQAMEANPGYQPQIFGYLIHYGFYPQPRGYHASEGMLPPIPLSAPEFDWERFNLTPDQLQNKRLSIQKYKTQLLLLRNFLPSFERGDGRGPAIGKGKRIFTLSQDSKFWQGIMRTLLC